MGKNLASFRKVVFQSTVFWLKMQQSTFLKKNRFESFFYKIKEQMVLNWTDDFNKHQTLGILFKVDTLIIF